MRIISWNVNGLRAVMKKNFESILDETDADIFCLQETKMSRDVEPITFEGFTAYWNFADKKGYSGTAVLSRRPVVKHFLGIGRDEHDHEGRVVTAEYDDFYLVNVYTPNSQTGLARLDYRMLWEEAFLDYVMTLDRIKPVVICGDLNVAHREIDLKNPKANRNNPGFTDAERNAFSRLLDAGFTDTFRQLHPDVQKYSWWSYRYNARAKNIGWRIDYFLVSHRFADRVKHADILDHIVGSDHCPVVIEIKSGIDV